MKPTTTKLTDEQATQLGAEFRVLFEQAQQQLIEHKLWMQTYFDTTIKLTSDDGPMSFDRYKLLYNQINEITLDLVRPEPAMQEEAVTEHPAIVLPDDSVWPMRSYGPKPTVSIVWSYPDELHDYLSSMDAPPALRLVNQGGVTLGEHEIITGFTKVKATKA